MQRRGVLLSSGGCHGRDLFDDFFLLTVLLFGDCRRFLFICPLSELSEAWARHDFDVLHAFVLLAVVSTARTDHLVEDLENLG